MNVKSPLEEERSKLKRESLQLEQSIATLKEEIEAQKIYLQNAIDYEEKGAKTKEEKTKVWKRECLVDPDIVSNRKLLEKYQLELIDTKTRLSEINFNQRERQTKAAEELGEKIDQFIQAMTPFAIASQEFRAGAVRVETAIQRLTN